MGTLLWDGAVWPDLSDGRSLSSKFVGADEMFAKMVVQAIESVKVRLHGWIGRVFCCCDFGEKYNCEEGPGCRQAPCSHSVKSPAEVPGPAGKAKYPVAQVNILKSHGRSITESLASAQSLAPQRQAAA